MRDVEDVAGVLTLGGRSTPDWPRAAARVDHPFWVGQRHTELGECAARGSVEAVDHLQQAVVLLRIDPTGRFAGWRASSASRTRRRRRPGTGTPRGRFHRIAVPTMSIQAPELQARPSHGCPSMPSTSSAALASATRWTGSRELASPAGRGRSRRRARDSRPRRRRGPWARASAGPRRRRTAPGRSWGPAAGGTGHAAPPRAAGSAVGTSSRSAISMASHCARTVTGPAWSVDEQATLEVGVPGPRQNLFRLLPGASHESREAVAQVTDGVGAVPGPRRGGTRQRRSVAGLPPTIAPAGTFLVTTAPAAITALSPRSRRPGSPRGTRSRRRCRW